MKVNISGRLKYLAIEFSPLIYWRVSVCVQSQNVCRVRMCVESERV